MKKSKVGLYVITIQQENDSKEKAIQMKSIERSSIQSIMQMQHNLQNCTLCDPSKYCNIMSFTTQIYHGF